MCNLTKCSELCLTHVIHEKGTFCQLLYIVISADCYVLTIVKVNVSNPGH